MNKGIAIKAGIILGFFGLVLGLAFGCSSIKDKNTTPQIENGEDVYLTVGDLTITNQELWEKMKISDGLNYLSQYVEEILLADYISNVTQEQIDLAVEEAIYGTNDAGAIARIREDAEQEQELILNYERSLVLQGFDPDNADDVRSYFELSIAQENYTRDFLKDAGENDTLYVSDDDVKARYESTVQGDVCAIVVRFSSFNEASAIFDHFNLVPDYEGGIGKYTGDTPIEDVLGSDFDETNTTLLTDQDALYEFMKMYNYMYPNRTQLTGAPKLDEFCDTYGDEMTYVYDDFTDPFLSTRNQGTFADYLWDTLQVESEFDEDDVPDDLNRYSYTTKIIDDFHLMVFKVSEEAVPAYEDLSSAEVDAIYNELIDEKITNSNISIAMDVLWEEYDFEIFDPMFKLQYEFSESKPFDNRGSATVVATFDGEEITAQELFEYMADKLGTYYTIEMIKAKSLLASDYYTDLYGESHDYLNSNNDKMKEHREELREMKSIFSSDGYAQYGFSSAEYTWEEFLVIAFGSYTEALVIQDLFIMGSLQPYMVRDNIDYNDAVDFIQARIDEYFSLNATHLLLFKDDDFDFAPDEFNDYVDGLEGQDATDHNTLMVQFENLVLSKVNNDDYSLEDIVDEYKDTLLEDPDNDWAAFKAAGYYITTENLSQANPLSPATTENFDEDFVTALKRIYDDFVVKADADEDFDEYVDDQLVQSNFGMHFIIATKGSGFDQPTAEFEDVDGDYVDGFENDSMVPSESQIELYIQIAFAELTDQDAGVTAPSDLYAALETYYGEVFDSYFTSSGYTIATAEYILAQNPVYATDQEARVQFLNNVVEVLYEVAFPEEFITPAE